MDGSFFFISLLFILILTKASTSPKHPLRVIGGADVVEEQYRYVVAIRHWLKTDNFIQNIMVCTGSVISSTWTLTAYHCEIEKADDLFSTVLHLSPTENNYNDSSKYNVHYFVHPATAKILLEAAFINDISLAKTDPIQIEIYGKLSAVDYRALYGHEVMVFGYGNMNYTEDGNKGQMQLESALSLENPLQTAKAMLYDCHEYTKVHISQRYLVCLGFACNRQSMICSGDSGGPIIHPLAGIVAVNHAVSINSICLQNLNADPETVRPINTAYGTLVEPNLSWIMNKLREE